MSDYNINYKHVATVQLSNHPGFPHYYATVWFKDGDIDERLSFRMTARDAAEFNKADRRDLGPARFRAGHLSERFLGRDRARDAARTFFRDRLIPLGARFLVEGSVATLSAQEVIDCAPGLEDASARLNEIHGRIEAIYAQHAPRAFQRLPPEQDKAIDALWDEWQELLESVLAGEAVNA